MRIKNWRLDYMKAIYFISLRSNTKNEKNEIIFFFAIDNMEFIYFYV